MSETARVMPWDGSPTNRCDHIDCATAPILHVEFTHSGSEYGAESDLCEEHLPAVLEQGRAFLVALGVIAPSTQTEQNVRAATGEHLPRSESSHAEPAA